MQATIRVFLLCLCVPLACGCAAARSGKPDARDPWEGLNRVIYRFNDDADRAITRPVARVYRRVTPRPVQTGVSNFFVNLGYPVVMLNDLLQGQLKALANDTGRLLLNTTLGIGGILDPATAAGLDRNERDFGQTLGKWGARAGPYLVLPLLGPCDVRDTFGRTGDFFSDPRHYIDNDLLSYSLWALGVVDLRAHLLDYDAVLASAYDPYAFVRNAYLQHREFKVSGGRSASEEQQEQQLLEESGIEETPPPAAPPGTPPKSPPPKSPPPPPE